MDLVIEGTRDIPNDATRKVSAKRGAEVSIGNLHFLESCGAWCTQSRINDHGAWYIVSARLT